MAVYLARLDGVREYLDESGTIPCPDRCTWVSQGKIANRLQLSDRTVRTAEQWLVAHGFLYECATTRMNGAVDSTCWWVVDVVGEETALRRWARDRDVELRVASDGDDPTQAIKAEIADARARSQAAHEGHYPTAGRVLALLEGREPHVPPTKAEAREAYGKAKTAIAKVLTERGVAGAAELVDKLVAARKPPPAKDLRRWLEDGTLEALLPATVGPVVDAPTVDEAFEVTDSHPTFGVDPAPIVEDPPAWATVDDAPVPYVLADSPVAVAVVTPAPASVLTLVPTDMLARVGYRALKAREDFVAANRPTVLRVAAARGVSAGVAGELIWEARCAWIGDRTDPATGDEPAADEVDAALTGIVDALLARPVAA